MNNTFKTLYSLFWQGMLDETVKLAKVSGKLKDDISNSKHIKNMSETVSCIQSRAQCFGLIEQLSEDTVIKIIINQFIDNKVPFTKESVDIIERKRFELVKKLEVRTKEILEPNEYKELMKLLKAACRSKGEHK